MRTLQIGVIGSMADLKYSEKLKQMAKDLGKEIAVAGFVLVFGAEKDSDSLSTIAARSARQNDGLTVGITYEKGLEIYDSKSADIVVASGLVRGGGREMVQSLSCDGIVAISGGSGTLNEMTVAYQANIPVVVISGSGGWAQKLEGTFLDSRERYKYASAKNAEEAIQKLLKMLK